MKEDEMDEYLKKEIEMDDIKQGYRGDCYFLTSISALANLPISYKMRTV